MTTHQEIDQRSMALHRLIAEKIRQDPALFENMKRTLARWRKIVCADSQSDLEEWEQIVNQGTDACLAVVATENSERANAKRQASPFCGILTNEERWQFLLEQEKNPGASGHEITARHRHDSPAPYFFWFALENTSDRIIWHCCEADWHRNGISSNFAHISGYYIFWGLIA